MILNIITQTHNRRDIFLKNFKINFKKISEFIKDINIKINWIINCDDQSITKEDLNYSNSKIDIFFYKKTNFFPKRYFELMLIKNADLIWCLEDDDIIKENFLKFLTPNYNFIFYYQSPFKKINQNIDYYLKKREINFITWQLSQIVMRYKDLKKFYFLMKKTSFFKSQNYINYDEDILKFIINKCKYKIIPKKIFIQGINGDNMSMKDLEKWK